MPRIKSRLDFVLGLLSQPIVYRPDGINVVLYSKVNLDGSASANYINLLTQLKSAKAGLPKQQFEKFVMNLLRDLNVKRMICLECHDLIDQRCVRMLTNVMRKITQMCGIMFDISCSKKGHVFIVS